MRKPIPWLDSWLNSDQFRPPILDCTSKIAIFRYPQNPVFSRFLGGPEKTNFGINTCMGGLNRSEFNQESSHGICFLIG